VIARAIAVALLIVVAGTYGRTVAGREVAPARQELREFPRTLDAWSSARELPLPAESLATLGVDDYVSRVYVNSATAQPVSLYVGYYASQRQGDTIHSPQNCLPGAGWQPVEGGRVQIPVNGRSIEVNRYVIEKGLDRQVVLYWYQGRGRIVASEYANKFWLMVDAARVHRTNGALVRVMAPIRRNAPNPASAEFAVTDFTRVLLAQLNGFLP
jgi:EpsI family protein